MLAPARVALGFFKDGNPFAQPAWNLVAGQLQGHHMAELVPQDCPPIARGRFLLGWAVGGDDLPKTNSEITRVFRHSKSSTSEIIGIGEDFNCDWGWCLKTVFGIKSGAGFF